LDFRYLTDSDYKRAFYEFGNFRAKIAEKIRELSASDENIVLDFLAGHGLLSAEIAKLFPEAKIYALGLSKDAESWKRLRGSERFPETTWRGFHYLTADARHIPLKSSTCEIVVNFLGLEDLRMTSGTEGIHCAISEIGRIAKDNALVQVSMVEYGEKPEEKIAEEVWKAIGLNATFLEENEYLRLFEKEGMHKIEELKLKWGRKMTPRQAREELEFACKEAPRIFSSFGVEAVSIDDLWDRFGHRIEEWGMAYWSRLKAIILRKQ